jgi:hypothetical protein
MCRGGAGIRDRHPPRTPPATVPPPTTTPPTATGGKTRDQIEAEGREYDRQHGYIGGYYDEQRGVWVNGSPHIGGGGDTPGGPKIAADGGGGPDYSQLLPFSPYHEYGPLTPRDATFDFEPFSYEPFTKTSYADLENQPGYKEEQARLQKQIEAGAAHRGIVRSGMTIGDIWNGLDTNKSQRFSEFDNRRVRDYQVNRGNAFENWGANLGANRNKFLDEYGIDRDIYDRGATENDRANNYRFNTEKSSFDASLDKWKTMVDSLTRISTAGTP